MPTDARALADEKPDPAWYVLAKMSFAIANGRGIRLRHDELQLLQESVVGQLIRAAREYGASTAGARPDPILLPGATIVAADALRHDAGAEMREPPPGLLMSMAIRYDHGLGAPGYYDQEIFKITKQPSHAQRLACTLTTMRQLWEEVAGTGFYSPAREAEYVALRDRALPLQTEEHGGAS